MQTEPVDAPKSVQPKHSNPGRQQEGSPGITQEVWKPHKFTFPSHNFTHQQMFPSSMTILDLVKFSFLVLPIWNCEPGLFSQGFTDALVIFGGLAALGASEPALGVQGQAGCDSQHGRQGIHFPKKSEVSSVSPNPGVTHEGQEEFTGQSGCGTILGCHGTTTKQTLGHLWWPRPALPHLAAARAQRGISTRQGGEGSKPGNSRQGMRLPEPSWVA